MEFTEHRGMPCSACERAMSRPGDGGGMFVINTAPPEYWPSIWLLNEDAPVYCRSTNPGLTLCAFHAETRTDWAAAWRRYRASQQADG